MAIILHIDTATEFASVCLSDKLNILAFEANIEQKNHASFLQPAIKKIMQEMNISLIDIDAISVTNGPGSYTGLRVGLASAKGLCFALNKPLILLNTLEVMAEASKDWLMTIGEKDLENEEKILTNIEQRILNKEVLTRNKTNEKQETSTTLFCPMIDARRMEVFTALFTSELIYVKSTHPLILDENKFADYLKNQTIIFSGSGAEKAKLIFKSTNAKFSNVQHSAKSMIAIALNKFKDKSFSDIAYATPNYGKEFYTIPSKK